MGLGAFPAPHPQWLGMLGHARHAGGQLRDGRGRPDRRHRRPLRRPDHRQAVGVRAAREVHPHRHRPGRDLQERPRAHPDRGRREEHPRAAARGVPRLRARPEPPERVVGADRAVAGPVPAALRRLRGQRDQAAVPDPGALRGDERRRLHPLLRHRPAPDVGGAVLPLLQAAPVDQLRRPRARWASACPRRWAPRSRMPDLPSVLHLGRRVDPDEHPGARDAARPTASPSRS